MVQGGDLTTISATTTEATANAVLIIVRPQKSWMQMPGLSIETFHGQRQKTVTESNEQLQAANKYEKKHRCSVNCVSLSNLDFKNMTGS